MKEYGWSLDHALAYVKKRRNCITPNKEARFVNRVSWSSYKPLRVYWRRRGIVMRLNLMGVPELLLQLSDREHIRPRASEVLAVCLLPVTPYAS
ncbi:hypothetical protein TELCIR_10605 [Teladorsagia circumcincta]|uniref:Uncharacterized protein n=1 Tax=Teladorsagia circumcincta TaxID=45464 RepID=A0A2G9UBN7_TELCI|nr:hypothetical protein TELCIR_10605 [Teladorsagia circumcincta]